MKMHKHKLFWPLAIVAIVTAVLVTPAAALPDNPTSKNTRFIDWQERPHVVHIFVFDDDGRPGQPVAHVDAGQPLLFGFEWVDGTVDDLNAFVANTDHDITVSVNGGSAFSVKSDYQDAFVAESGSGPPWKWDHDGDGRGDGDGDGIGDWNGPIVFFRYQHPGLAAGTHTFVFTLSDPDPDIDGGTDTITFEVD